jgi:hypothetical protein
MKVLPFGVPNVREDTTNRVSAYALVEKLSNHLKPPMQLRVNIQITAAER